MWSSGFDWTGREIGQTHFSSVKMAVFADKGCGTYAPVIPSVTCFGRQVCHLIPSPYVVVKATVAESPKIVAEGTYD